jgi:hypothetical protein
MCLRWDQKADRTARTVEKEVKRALGIALTTKKTKIALTTTKKMNTIMRLLLVTLVSGLSLLPSIAAPTLGSNPPWYPSVMASEHYDSGRTKLFPEANFNGSFNQDNVVNARVSPDDYLTPYNVVYLNAQAMFLYGGGYGDKGGTGAFVARVDPSTLSMVWSNQFVYTVPNTNCNPQETSDWDYPGVLGILKDGFLYVIYGYQLTKLDPQDGSIVATTNLPSLWPLKDTSYNGFDALPDGTIIAKTVYRQVGCPCQGFSAFLECPGAAGVTNSLIVAINPQTLEVIDQIEAKEFTVGRLTCVQFAGKNCIYLPGQTNIYRYLFETNHLSLDTSWGPVAYLELGSGQTPASSVAVMNDWIVFADNGTPVNVPTNGTTWPSPWMTVMAINQADSSKTNSLQPYKGLTAPTAPGLPISFSPSAVTVDPLRNRIFSLDAGPGVVGALELREDGLHTVWIENQRTAEFLTLIGPRERRVLVGTDVPAGQFPGNNTTNTVVWREAETGRELVRSAPLPAVVTGTIVEPGYGGRMYYFTGGSKLLELTVRPAPAKGKLK